MRERERNGENEEVRERETEGSSILSTPESASPIAIPVCKYTPRKHRTYAADLCK